MSWEFTMAMCSIGFLAGTAFTLICLMPDYGGRNRQLERNNDEQAEQIAELEAEKRRLNDEIRQWRNAFRDVSEKYNRLTKPCDPGDIKQMARAAEKMIRENK